MPRVLDAAPEAEEAQMKRPKLRLTLESNATGELEGTAVSTRVSKRAKGSRVYRGWYLQISCVESKGDCVGHVLAIHAEDKLHTSVNIKGAPESAREPEVARRPKTVGTGARGISNHVGS